MPVTSTSPDGVTTFSIVISFFVSVPVLSEHTTDAEPSVSTEDSLFTIARWRAMRCTPRASTTDRMAGSPSGTAATASDTPTSSTSTRSEASSMSAVSRIAVDDDDGDRDDGEPEHAPDAVDLALQRRALLLGAAEQAGDVAHLGGHAGRRHDGPAPPTRDGGAVEHHVHPVAQAGRLGERRDVLQHRFALAGQRRLGDRERRRLDQPGVGARPRRPRPAAARRPARRRRPRTRSSRPSRTTPAVAAAIRCSAATACSARASCT